MEVKLAIFIIVVLLGTIPPHMRFWENVAKNKELSTEWTIVCICISLPISPLTGIYQIIKEIFKR
jgi:hypothetical protein